MVESTSLRTQFERVAVPSSPSDFISRTKHLDHQTTSTPLLCTATLRITTAGEAHTGRDPIEPDGALHTFASLHRLPFGWLTGHGQAFGAPSRFASLHADRVADGATRELDIADLGSALDLAEVTATITDTPSLPAAFEVIVSAAIATPNGHSNVGSCALVVSTLDRTADLERDVYRTHCHFAPPGPAATR